MSSGTCMLHYPSGMLATNEWGMGFDDSSYLWEWVIEGEKGRLRYDLSTDPHSAILERKDQEDVVLEIASQMDVHPAAMESVIAQVLDGTAPYPSAETSRHIIHTCEQLLVSATTGQGVDHLGRALPVNVEFDDFLDATLHK